MVEITSTQIQTNSLETNAKYCSNFLENHNANFHFLKISVHFYLLVENTLQVQTLKLQMTKTVNTKEFKGSYEHCIS